MSLDLQIDVEKGKENSKENELKEYKFEKLGDYKGYVWNYALRGEMYMYQIIFLAPTILYFAKKTADSNGEVSAGVNASSVLSITHIIFTLFVLLFSPILGAFCDYTSYRKQILIGCLTVSIVAILFTLMLRKETWQAVVVIFLFGLIAAEISGVPVNSYLPELSKNSKDIAKATSMGIIFYTCSTIIYSLVAYSVTNIASLNTANSNRLACVIAFVVSVPLAFYSCKMFTSREAAHILPQGKSIYTIGFVQIKHSIKELKSQYPVLGQFLFSRSFYTGAIRATIALASSYLVGELDFKPSKVSLILMVGFLCGIPGAMYVRYLAKFFPNPNTSDTNNSSSSNPHSSTTSIMSQETGVSTPTSNTSTTNTTHLNNTQNGVSIEDVIISNPEGGDEMKEIPEDESSSSSSTFPSLSINPKTVIMGILIYKFISFALAPFLMYKPEHASVAFVLVGTWGFTTGMLSSCDKAFYSSMIPGGQEGEFFGIYAFSNSALEWLPPLVFTLFNETMDSMRWSLFSVCGFYLVALLLLLTVDPTLAALQIQHTMNKRRLSLCIEISDSGQFKENGERIELSHSGSDGMERFLGEEEEEEEKKVAEELELATANQKDQHVQL